MGRFTRAVADPSGSVPYLCRLARIGMQESLVQPGTAGAPSALIADHQEEAPAAAMKFLADFRGDRSRALHVP